jgi:hypothetical protein
MALHPSIRIEGGLLGPDVVDQLLSGELAGQRPADFGFEGRRSLTDEIAATFADTKSLWAVFQRRLDKLSVDDLATGVTRDAWVVPFLGLLGFDLKFNSSAYEVDGMSFAISHRAGESDFSPPVHIVGFRQELGRVAASGRPRLAPHSLVQEYVNRTENVWGVVTNGKTLRLIRDCTFVRRQAYIEFDLPGIIEEQRFQDFAALYRLLHRTRLPRSSEDTASCFLEQYYSYSIEQGGRVREHLREGVEECLKLLANGFLRHQSSVALRKRVHPSYEGADKIEAEDFYRQLLILVYRFLFLLVSEDRGLLSASDLYRDHYSIGRLRKLVEQRSDFTEHDDLWQSLRSLWLMLANDHLQPSLNMQPMASVLGLSVLNGDLFAREDLDEASISNRDLLYAFWNLAWYLEGKSKLPRRVNYAALDVEELGSVYESLLELHPFIQLDHSGNPEFDFAKGGGRKETGSYYTPPELVSEVIKSALEPVIANRLAGKKTASSREKAILSIRVCDPACGSGHFLLAAARRLGKELARVRTGEDEPAPERVRESIRDCVSHCIYGVDKNQLAVDLCRVALWLEGHTVDKPLTFLDHRIRCGDSLVGVFDLDVLSGGIPDKAFEPLEGDDKLFARELARKNREERGGVRDLEGWSAKDSVPDWNLQSRQLDEIPDDSPAAIRQKKELYERSHHDPSWIRQKESCDLWTAAFFQPLKPNTPAITTALLSEYLLNRSISKQVLALGTAIAFKQKFFHWPLEFPDVFNDGGFDVVLSNPPWEHVELKEQEFFAPRNALISSAKTKALRTKLIRELELTNPTMFDEYVFALRSIDATRQFLAHSGRFQLTGRGRINTYAVFTEFVSLAANSNGRSGAIVPTGIATDETTKFFFAHLVEKNRLVDLVGFENEDFIFSKVHHAFKFCKLTISGIDHPVGFTNIAFFIRKFDELSNASRYFKMTGDDFKLLNPNTRNCPIFRTHIDSELTKAIYRRNPVLWREPSTEASECNPWCLRFQQGLFNMASDSHLFKTQADMEADGYHRNGNVYESPYDRYLPLFEAKMLQQFDHRFSTYENATEKQLNVGILPQPSAKEKADPNFVVQPRYWVREEIVESTIPKSPEALAIALQLGHRQSVQRILLMWVAGQRFVNGDVDAAHRLVLESKRYDLDKSVAKSVSMDNPLSSARLLQIRYPLSSEDADQICGQLVNPESIAKTLLERFSPKWLMGWRDITNAGNERTTIASVLDRSAAVGHTFPLIFTPEISPEKSVILLAQLNSFVFDYCTRQKVGGTHLTYGLLKQLPALSPNFLDSRLPFSDSTALEFFLNRVVELCFTSNDLRLFARDVGFECEPFVWDDNRRFQIRCEIDAAMFHLFLPCSPDGNWIRTVSEPSDDYSELIKHFPSPRHAVKHVMEQFRQVRETDEKNFEGTYRTRDEILEVYDAMLTALGTGVGFCSPLSPPPGVRP